MSHKERVMLALINGCAVNVDVAAYPPSDLIEIATLAVKGQIKMTFRNCNEKAPDTLKSLTTIGAGLIAFEF